MKRKQWDLNEFNKVNLPEVVGKVTAEVNFSMPRGLRFLDMLVYTPKQGLKIPHELLPFNSLIFECMMHEREIDFSFWHTHNVYVTLDQKIVNEGETGRRAGAHSDAFVATVAGQVDITFENKDLIAQETGEVSHTYIVSDCFPTEFFNAAFPLTAGDCESSLQTFDEIADNSEVITYAPYSILKLDPYVVHRCAIAHTTCHRTFLKVSISRKKYNREGNTINPEFDYSDWTWIPRNWQERNHPAV